MSMAEFLFILVLGYGVYRLLKPFQEWLERTLSGVSGERRRSRGEVIDVKPEPSRKKGS
jgi:hypothetical protein